RSQRRIRQGAPGGRLSSPERREIAALRWRGPAAGDWKAPLHLRGARPRGREDRDRSGSDTRLPDVHDLQRHPWTRLPRGLVRAVDPALAIRRPEPRAGGDKVFGGHSAGAEFNALATFNAFANSVRDRTPSLR